MLTVPAHALKQLSAANDFSNNPEDYSVVTAITLITLITYDHACGLRH